MQSHLQSKIDHAGGGGNRFKVFVAWIDQGGTLEDLQQTPALNHISPRRSNRNLHIKGIRMDGNAQPIMDIVVLVGVLGDVNMPQVGDIVWVEQDKQAGGQVRYLFSDYSYADPAENGGNPVPQWLSQPGDYGTLRSYKDHAMRFAKKPVGHIVEELIQDPANDFRAKWIRSITGTRFRRFYKSNLIKDKFVLRGDSVFDISETPLMQDETITEDGFDLLEGPKVKKEQWRYPNPLNVPKKREKDKTFRYRYMEYVFNRKPTFDEKDENKDGLFFQDREALEVIQKIKNYLSYEPIRDKTYLGKAKFERELIATEEYTLAIKGDNKLSIIDHYGDGEQVTILLKNHFDAGLAIIHNANTGQVRIRDHLGQSILIEGDREKPRINITTYDRQIIEVGSFKEKDPKWEKEQLETIGGYLYLRNGEEWGKSDTEKFGRKPKEKKKEDVFNQEFLMVDSVKVIKHEEFHKRLSEGLRTMLVGPGIYHRTVDDGPKKYEKQYASYEFENTLVEETWQIWKSARTHVHQKIEVPDSGDNAIWFVEETYKNCKNNSFIFADKDKMIFSKKTVDCIPIGYIAIDRGGIHIETEPSFPINIGTLNTKQINIGNPLTAVKITGATVMIDTLDLPIIGGI